MAGMSFGGGATRAMSAGGGPSMAGGRGFQTGKAIPVGQKPVPVPQQDAPQASTPLQAPAPASAPIQGLQSAGESYQSPAMTFNMNVQRPLPPQAPPPPMGAPPMDALQDPGISLFDFGQPVQANPKLGRRNPAVEGLILNRNPVY